MAGSGTLRSAWRDAARVAGLQAVEAGGADEALAALRALGPVDVALIEWNPASGEGARLLDRLRAQRDCPPMRLVVVTPDLRCIPLTEAFRAGADDFLLRPFTAETLGRKLQALGLREEAR